MHSNYMVIERNQVLAHVPEHARSFSLSIYGSHNSWLWRLALCVLLFEYYFKVIFLCILWKVQKHIQCVFILPTSHDLPPTPHRTNLHVWFCKLGQYFLYRSFFLSHVVILNWNIFRNTPLQTFAKKITYLKWSRGIPLWCQEHMPEQYWGAVRPHHLVLFFSTPPPNQLSQYLCLVRNHKYHEYDCYTQNYSSPAAW